MCSIQEEGEVFPEKRDVTCSEDVICTKCQQKPAVIVIRVDHKLCKECFLAYAVHKFRSAIGKSRLFQDGDKVMLAYSGGACSSALLHFCIEGKAPRAPKKLRFIPSVVYIDEGGTLGWSLSERLERSKHILASMENAPMECYVLTMEQALLCDGDSFEVQACDKPEERLSELLNNEQHAALSSKLTDMLSSAKTLTCKDNLLNTLRLRLLTRACTASGHSKLMLGDTCSRLSVRLLSSITQGRGAHIAHEMAFGDARLPDVMVLRPLRDFLAKEIVLYNSLQNIEPTILPNMSTMESSTASLDRLTEGFLNGLQAEFPATVSTVFRTGTKLHASVEDMSGKQMCTMCKSAVDTDVSEASALSSTEFSWSLCHKASDSTSETSSVGYQQKLSSLLCYGCRLTVRDMKDVNNLPDFVKARMNELNDNTLSS